MLPTEIAKLTPEQEASIPLYREKWRTIAFSTQPIDRNKASMAVKAAYAAIGLSEPEIIFLSSPHAIGEVLDLENSKQLAQQWGAPVLSWLPNQLSDRLREQLKPQLLVELQSQLANQQFSRLMLVWQDALTIQQKQILAELWLEWQDEFLMQFYQQQQTYWRQQLIKQPGGELFAQIGDFVWTQVGEPFSKQLETNLWKPLVNQPTFQQWFQQWQQPGLLILSSVGFVSAMVQNWQALPIEIIDFCISVLNCSYDPKQWSALQSLVTECGWVFPLSKTCIVCDRPRQLRFDSQDRLHGEGEPAIAFEDGYKVYSYQGVILPEKYGKLHPHQWQSGWLLEEQNAELRRVLIQGIGYSRICQELEAEELDVWREYTLLKIDNNNVDVEPIYLLKMTCPSTAYIHVTRVPPTTRSAREAIRWVNWGIDPEEFSVET